MPTNTVANSSTGAPVTTGGTYVSAAPKGFRTKVSQMLAGLEAVIPDGSSVTVGGQSVAKSDLVTEMTQIISAYQGLDAAVSATKGVRSQLKAQIPGFHQQFLELKDGLVSSLGRGSPQLAQFGITAAKPAKPLNPTQKVVRAEKAKNTRAMRHTMGPRQTAAVQYTGNVQVSVSSMPVTNPADGTATVAEPVAMQGTAVAVAVPGATPEPANSRTQ
jgi:hypothetical protein